MKERYERVTHWAIAICLISICGSCTARMIYCDWADCESTKIKIDIGEDK